MTVCVDAFCSTSDHRDASTTRRAPAISDALTSIERRRSRRRQCAKRFDAAIATLTDTAARPVRDPRQPDGGDAERERRQSSSTVGQGRAMRRASTTAPIVQNAATAPSLFGSASVPDARIM